MLNNPSKLSYYINKFQINKIFTKNIEKYMELHYFKKYYKKRKRTLDIVTFKYF